MTGSPPFDRRTLIQAGLMLPLAATLPGRAEAALFSRRIAVRTEGAGSDVILIPGLGAGPDTWTDAVAANPDHRYTYVHVRGFDGLPASGNAPGLSRALLFDTLVDELIRYIETMGLRRPAIVGHSMGGLIGMMLAIKRPDLAGRVMVVDMLPGGAAMLGGTADGMGFLGNQLFGYFIGTDAGRRAFAGIMHDFAPGSTGNDPAVIAQALNEMSSIDLTAQLDRIRAPLTVIYAVPSDRTKRAEQARRYRTAYANARNATLVPIGPSGHMVMLQQPAQFAAALHGFLG